MKIYRTYIRSKLNHGSPIYASAASTILQSLNTITTEAIRIATGAFRSTPTATLHVLANEMTLEHRRAYLSLRYYYKIKNSKRYPATLHLIPVTYKTLLETRIYITL